jgi:hypothetical protein
MNSYIKQVTVNDSKQLILSDLPFKPGQQVEIQIKVVEKDRSAIAQELKALFKELQSLPSSEALTEEDIAAEIDAYRQQPVQRRYR